MKFFANGGACFVSDFAGNKDASSLVEKFMLPSRGEEMLVNRPIART